MIDLARGGTRRLVGINFIGENKEADRLLTGNLRVTGADREVSYLYVTNLNGGADIWWECWNWWGSFASVR